MRVSQIKTFGIVGSNRNPWATNPDYRETLEGIWRVAQKEREQRESEGKFTRKILTDATIGELLLPGAERSIRPTTSTGPPPPDERELRPQ